MTQRLVQCAFLFAIFQAVAAQEQELPVPFELHQAAASGEKSSLEELLAGGTHDVDATLSLRTLVTTMEEKSMTRDAALAAALSSRFGNAIGHATKSPLVLQDMELTPLGLAALVGDVESVNLLIEHGAQVDRKGAASALHLCLLSEIPAQRFGDKAVELASRVLMQGLGTGGQGLKMLQHREKIGQIATILLEKGASPRVSTPHLNATSPLHAAAETFGHFDVLVLALIDAGADVDVRDGNGQTPLQYACARLWKGFNEMAARHLHTLKALLDRGADVNVRDTSGNPLSTPLALVATQGIHQGSVKYLDMLELLVRHGAAIDVLDSIDIVGHGWWQTPLKFPWQYRWPEGGSLLHVAASEGHVDLATALIMRGASWSATDAAGHTPREVAAANHRRWVWGFRSNWPMVELCEQYIVMSSAKDEL